MPRNARIIAPRLPYHVTQRGTVRQRVFFTSADRSSTSASSVTTSRIPGPRPRLLASWPTTSTSSSSPAMRTSSSDAPMAAGPQHPQRTHGPPLTSPLSLLPNTRKSPLLDRFALCRGESLLRQHATGRPEGTRTFAGGSWTFCEEVAEACGVSSSPRAAEFASGTRILPAKPLWCTSRKPDSGADCLSRGSWPWPIEHIREIDCRLHQLLPRL